MKKKLSLIAIVGAAAGAAQAQSSITIYGRLETAVTVNDTVAKTPATTAAAAGATGSRIGMDTGILAGSRIGFRGVEDLGGGMKALFNLENGMNPDTGTMGQGGLLFGRRASVGLSGSLGTINFGRFWERGGEGFAFYNSLLDFGVLILNVHNNCQDRSVGCYRVNNGIRYDSPNFNGFTGSVTLGLGEQAGNQTAGRTLAVTGEYSTAPFGIGITYFEGRLGATPSDTAQPAQGALAGAPGDVALRSTSLGARYLIGPAKLYGSYTRTRQPLAVASPVASFAAAPTFLPTGTAFTAAGSNNSRTDVLDIGINYRLASPVTLVASAQHERIEFVGARDGKVSQINAGAQYHLSKRSFLYGIMSAQRASDTYAPGIIGGAPGRDKGQRVLTLGVVHLF